MKKMCNNEPQSEVPQLMSTTETQLKFAKKSSKKLRSLSKKDANFEKRLQIFNILRKLMQIKKKNFKFILKFEKKITSKLIIK